MIKFIHPDKVVPQLVAAMTHYEQYLKAHFPSSQITVHSDWDASGTGGHVNESQHYTGHACDFDVSNVPLVEAWLALERIPEVRGIGIYPAWISPGLHADVRETPERARWWRNKDNSYLDVNSALVKLTS